MREPLPLAATTVKGRTRAAMPEELCTVAAAGRVSMTIGRASDFFGAGVTGPTLRPPRLARALAGKRAPLLGHPRQPRALNHGPDGPARLADLGLDASAAAS